MTAHKARKPQTPAKTPEQWIETIKAALPQGARIEKHDCLFLSVVDEKHPADMGYKYIVTKGALSFTAFKTRPALLGWLNDNNLTLPGLLGEEGKPQSMMINGGFDTVMIWDVETLINIPGDWFYHMNNGTFTAAKQIINAENRVLWVMCNPNVKTKPVFNFWDVYKAVDYEGQTVIDDFSGQLAKSAATMLDGQNMTGFFSDKEKIEYLNYWVKSPLISEKDKKTIKGVLYPLQRKNGKPLEDWQINKSILGLIDKESTLFAEYGFYLYGNKASRTLSLAKGHAFFHVAHESFPHKYCQSVKLNFSVAVRVNRLCCEGDYTSVEVIPWNNGYSLIVASDATMIPKIWVGFIESEKVNPPELTPETMERVNKFEEPIFYVQD